MRTSKVILPGIKFIGWIPASRLPRRIQLAAICGMAVPVLANVNPIYFFDDPKCECKTAKSDGKISETCTLVFCTDMELPRKKDIAFIVIDVNDKSFIIGMQEPPFPEVETTVKTGSPNGDAAGIKYEIKHKSIKSLIPCVVAIHNSLN